MGYSPILAAYKNILKLAKQLPSTNQVDTVAKIKLEFRKNAVESDPEIVKKLLDHANSSISYLKIVTPRQSNRYQTGHTRIIFRNGVDAGIGGSKAVSNWTGKNLDPDSVKRHFNGLKRAGFRNNNDAKGKFF